MNASWRQDRLMGDVGTEKKFRVDEKDSSCGAKLCRDLRLS
jgi:hypothetical protein